jgi:hypothetical protein
VALVLSLAGGVALAASAPITRGNALAVADAINLRLSDMPGSQQTADPFTARQRTLDAELERCIGAGVPDSQAFAIVNSPSFVTAGASPTTIGSQVKVMPSAALASSDANAGLDQRGLACISTQLSALVRPSLAKNEKVGGARAAFLPRVTIGGLRVIGARIAVKIRVTHGATVVTVPLYSDSFQFVDGQLEVNFEDEQGGAKPSGVLEDRLITALVKRTRAALPGRGRAA